MPKILIADDFDGMRKQLADLISQEREWALCGEASNDRQAVLLAHKLKPDLIILDLVMPMLDGLQAATEILKSAPTVPIIIYTLHKSEQIELEGKKAGARRVISKTDPSDILIAAIRELLQKDAPSPRTMVQETRKTPPDNAPASELPDVLSKPPDESV